MNRHAALAGLAALGLASTAAGATAKPTMQPVGLQPLQIKGSHFRDGEKVLVTVLGAVRGSRRVTATSDGTWTVTFPTLKAKGARFSVRAVGNAGSAAFWLPRLLRPVVGPVTRSTNP
jgi:hypothetical protein